jgi:hypothetical protein
MSKAEGCPMKSWFHLMIQTVKVFLLFMGCTLLFYYGILWVSKEYESYHRYDEPQGKAVKVFQMDNSDVNSSSWIQRLLLFYQEGE